MMPSFRLNARCWRALEGAAPSDLQKKGSCNRTDSPGICVPLPYFRLLIMHAESGKEKIAELVRNTYLCPEGADADAAYCDSDAN